MTATAARALRCPICREAFDLDSDSRVLRCVRGHSFDVAREGYVNLQVGAAVHAGDSAEMVAARAAFLGSGHYEFIVGAVARLAIRTAGDADVVVDAGAGTGYYVNSVLNALPGAAGIALDASKAAIRRAAKAHPRASGVVTDVWSSLPVGDRVSGLVMNIFAPRNGREFRRILRDDGTLVVVTPQPGHLAELRDVLRLISVDAKKEERLETSLADFEKIHAEDLTRTLALSHQEMRLLVGMGPSARHVDPDELESRIAELPEPVLVTASVQVAGYRPRA